MNRIKIMLHNNFNPFFDLYAYTFASFMSYGTFYIFLKYTRIVMSSVEITNQVFHDRGELRRKEFKYTEWRAAQSRSAGSSLPYTTIN